MIPKVLNMIGIVCMFLVILITLPFAIPRLFGYQVYGILTDSMYPAYKPGDLIYVAEVSASEVRPGEVITYAMGTSTDLVNSHRVVRIDKESSAFITKGDAGGSEDMEPVAFARLKGKVVFRIPLLGKCHTLFESTAGKIKLLIFFPAACICWITADRMKKKEEGQ